MCVTIFREKLQVTCTVCVCVCVCVGVFLQGPTDLQAELARKIAAKRGGIADSGEASGLFGEDEDEAEAAVQPQEAEKKKKKKKKKKKTEKAEPPKVNDNGRRDSSCSPACVQLQGVVVWPIVGLNLFIQWQFTCVCMYYVQYTCKMEPLYQF